jgi:hypothetical protein
MATILDYNSREEFVRALNLFHYNTNTKQREFKIVSSLCQVDFSSELNEIKKNLELIKDTWNDQSISAIEKSVTAQGAKQVKIMSAQKHDKIQAGYTETMPMYRIKQCSSSSVFYNLAEAIGLEYAVSRYHVQFPGEVTVLHTDIFSPAHEFLPDFVKNTPDEQIGKDNNIRRVLIAMEDWNWGQILMFGADPWLQWKSGDIAYWKYGVPHCAANMGYSPRIMASITGLATDKFFKLFDYE